MTSQAQAAAPLPGVRGLAFVGFPLHPAGKPSTDRADHLAKIDIPMLFLQGTRDSLAEVALIEAVVKRLGPRATLHLADGADHSFHVLARSGRNDREVMNEILDAFAGLGRRALAQQPRQMLWICRSSASSSCFICWTASMVGSRRGSGFFFAASSASCR